METFLDIFGDAVGSSSEREIGEGFCNGQRERIGGKEEEGMEVTAGDTRGFILFG